MLAGEEGEGVERRGSGGGKYVPYIDRKDKNVEGQIHHSVCLFFGLVGYRCIHKWALHSSPRTLALGRGGARGGGGMKNERKKKTPNEKCCAYACARAKKRRRGIYSPNILLPSIFNQLFIYVIVLLKKINI